MMLSQNSLNKIKTYVGFAFKAGKCVLGVDNILNVKRPMLILYSSDLSENSAKKAIAHASTISSQIIKLENFNAISPREGCKALGVKDKSLADAIIKQLNIDN